MRRKTINGMRPCGTCHEILPANDVHFYETANNRLSSECRACFRNRSSRNQKKRHYTGGVEYHLRYIARAARQRARKDMLSYDIDTEYLGQVLALQDGLCAISKVPLTFTKGSGHIATNASVDRIDPNKGYTKDNVQLVAFQVNAMKSNLSIDQLVEWCRLIIVNCC